MVCVTVHLIVCFGTPQRMAAPVSLPLLCRRPRTLRGLFSVPFSQLQSATEPSNRYPTVPEIQEGLLSCDLLLSYCYPENSRPFHVKNPLMSFNGKKDQRKLEWGKFFDFKLKGGEKSAEQCFTVSNLAALALFLWYSTSRSGITAHCYCFDICWSKHIQIESRPGVSLL